MGRKKKQLSVDCKELLERTKGEILFKISIRILERDYTVPRLLSHEGLLPALGEIIEQKLEEALQEYRTLGENSLVDFKHYLEHKKHHIYGTNSADGKVLSE